MEENNSVQQLVVVIIIAVVLIFGNFIGILVCAQINCVVLFQTVFVYL